MYSAADTDYIVPKMSLSRSRTPSPSVQVGVDSDTEVLTSSPSPPPTAVSEECYRSSHAVYVFFVIYNYCLMYMSTLAIV